MVLFETKLKLLLFKRYFDQGMSILHYVRWLILFVGVSSLNPKVTVGLGFAYIAVCWIVGWCWFHFGWVEVEGELGARFNIMSKEIREHMGIKFKSYVKRKTERKTKL